MGYYPETSTKNIDYANYAFHHHGPERLTPDQALPLLTQITPTLFGKDASNSLNDITRFIPEFIRSSSPKDSIIIAGSVVQSNGGEIPTHFALQAAEPYGNKNQYGRHRVEVIIENHEFAALRFTWDSVFNPHGFSFYSMDTGHGFRVDPSRPDPVHSVLSRHRFNGPSPIKSVEVDAGLGYSFITYQRPNTDMTKLFTIPTAIVHGTTQK